MFQQLPMYQRKGKQAFKKDLTNILALCQALDNPQNNFQSIHVAGTNGKGSVSHMLASMLQSNGLRVGLYTSPHYLDFRERIKINGNFISELDVIDFINDHSELITYIKPSFFEITVAMAFNYFSDQQVDVAVIETGLGGRLDSTNIITPILSIITNISLDHESMLGNTLDKIAIEKAGIIKNNVPVVIGEKDDAYNSVFVNKSKEVNANLHFAQEEIDVNLSTSNGLYEIIRINSNSSDFVQTDIKGPFQLRNLLTTSAAYMRLVNDKLLNTKIEWSEGLKGLKAIKSITNYMGRWVVLQKNPLVIGDSAHNIAGLSIVLEEIIKMPYHKLHIVLGMVNDKNVDEIIKLFPSDAHYYFAKPNIPRGLDGEKMMKKANSFGLKGISYLSLEIAYNTALKNADIKDTIFFGGSTFVVAEVLEFTNRL